MVEKDKGRIVVDLGRERKRDFKKKLAEDELTMNEKICDMVDEYTESEGKE